MKRRMYAPITKDWVIRDNILQSGDMRFRKEAIRRLKRDRGRRMIRRMLERIEIRLTQKAINRLAIKLKKYYRKFKA